VRLAGLGLGVDRAARPSALDWFRYLSDYLDSITSPPRVLSFEVEDDLVLQGQAVAVRWEVRGAEHAFVLTPEDVEVRVDPALGEFLIPVRRTGALRMRVVNRHGEATAASHPVYVHVPPKVEFVQVPGPVLPGLDPDPGLTRVLARIVAAHGTGPVVELPEVGPALSFVDLPDLTGAVPTAGTRLPGTDSLTALLASIEADARSVCRSTAQSSHVAARRTASKTRNP
jgi:hypothetical protein